MPMQRKWMLATVVALFLAGQSVQAGGPLLYATDGRIIRWPAGGSNIALTLDRGNLGMLANTQADALVANTCRAWNNVARSTVNLTVSSRELSQDITDANYILILFSPTLLGYNPVVYDTDGAIVDDLLGVGGSNQVLGFSVGPEYRGTSIVEGRVLLNGRFMDGQADSRENPEVTQAEYEGVIVHELGHMLGLDHSQINLTDISNNDQPTMFPIFYGGTAMRTLAPDDIAWVSYLYPTADFATACGSMSGLVFRQTGSTNTGYQGINVIAHHLGGGRGDAVSCVSGYNYRSGGPTGLRGGYLMPGLVGGNYRVEVEEIANGFMGGSSVGPLDPPADFPGAAGHEYYNGAGESAGDDPRTSTPVAVVTGRRTPNINVILNTNPPPGGYQLSGHIVSATADQCYRGSTITLHLIVINTSNFDWGSNFCPAYAIKITGPWVPNSPVTVYQNHRVGSGQIDRMTILLTPAPPNVGGATNILAVSLEPQVRPTACTFVSVDQTLVPVTVVEWPDLILSGGLVMPPMGKVGELINVSFRETNRGPGPVVLESETEVRLSLDTEWNTSDTLITSVTVPPPMAAGQFRDFCLRAAIPVVSPGNYFVLIMCDALNEVPESPLGNATDGETNNVFVCPQRLSVLGADLAVTSASVIPAQAYQGEVVTLRYAVNNLGNTASVACRANIRLTSGPIVYTWLRDLPVPSIPPFTLRTLSITTQVLQVPVLIPGPYNLVVEVDFTPPYQNQEFNKQNNRLVVPNALQILGVASTDLAVTGAWVTPTSAEKGDPVTINFTVQNIGRVPSPQTCFANIYISSDTVGSSNYLWRGPVTVPVLAGGQSRTIAVSATVPNLGTLTARQYGLVVEVDTIQPYRITEPNKLNNRLFVPNIFQLVMADLVMLSGSISPTDAGQGDPLVLQFSVQNSGTTASVPCFAEIILTTSPLFTGGYLLRNNIAVPALGVGAVQNFSVNAVVPPIPNLRTQRYGLVFQVDLRTPYRVQEINKANNRFVLPNAFQVLMAELAVTSGSMTPSTVQQGNPVTLQFTVQNLGRGASAPCLADIRITTGGARSDEFLWVPNVNVPAIPANTTRMIPASAVVPAHEFIPQRYGVAFEVDYTPPYRVDELNKANNRLVVPNTFRIAGLDVAATSGSVFPRDGIPNDWVYVSLAIQNDGSVATGPFQAAAFLSTDAVWDAGDTQLTVPTITVPALVPDAIFNTGAACQVPPMRPGNYRLLIVADVNNVLLEVTKLNNVRIAGMFKVSAPDLTVGTATFRPPEGEAGTRVGVTIQIKNIGDRPATPTVTRVYLSRYPFGATPFPRPTDNPWFSFPTPRLGPPGGVPLGYPPDIYTLSSTATVPTLPALPVGYRILVQVDATSRIVEFDELNNIVDVGRFRIISGPDLVLPSGSARMLQGTQPRQAHVSVTVANNGDKPTGTSRMTLYLSRGSTWQASDPVWESNISIPVLAAGGTFEYSADLAVPSWVTGAHRVIARCEAADWVEEFPDNNSCDLGPIRSSTGVDRWIHYR
jgi:subtilase family serine protease